MNSFFLLQTGDYILLQTGDRLLLNEGGVVGGGGGGGRLKRKNKRSPIQIDDEEALEIVKRMLTFLEP